MPAPPPPFPHTHRHTGTQAKSGSWQTNVKVFFLLICLVLIAVVTIGTGCFMQNNIAHKNMNLPGEGRPAKVAKVEQQPLAHIVPKYMVQIHTQTNFDGNLKVVLYKAVDFKRDDVNGNVEEKDFDMISDLEFSEFNRQFYDISTCTVREGDLDEGAVIVRRDMARHPDEVNQNGNSIMPSTAYPLCWMCRRQA
jgi:hypothetical protein